MNTIKKYITSLALGVAVTGAMVSCDTLDEKFYNPDKLTVIGHSYFLPDDIAYILTKK